jgi:tetratricopeptide (TPR) repeat protein
VIELGGGDAVTYGLLGFAHLNRDDVIAAESAYRMANLLDPGTLDWKMGMARTLFKQERFADAVALTGQLIRDQPDRADLWMLQANAYIGLGQPMRAAENYEIVDRLGGSTPDALNMLADIYTNEELFDLAVDRYGQALEADSTGSPDRAIRAARVLVARGALDSVGELLDRIERVSGAKLSTEQRKDLLKLRARVAVAEGAAAEEARILEEIVVLDPLDGEALILLGQYFGRAGEPEKAIFHFERAAALEKFEADAKVRHAQLLVQQGKYSEALPLLRSAQQIRPRENIQSYLEQIERIARAR